MGSNSQNASRTSQARSKIRGDAFDLPVAVASGIKPLATGLLIRPVAGGAFALGAAGSGLGERALAPPPGSASLPFARTRAARATARGPRHRSMSCLPRERSRRARAFAGTRPRGIWQTPIAHPTYHAENEAPPRQGSRGRSRMEHELRADGHSAGGADGPVHGRGLPDRGPGRRHDRAAGRRRHEPDGLLERRQARAVDARRARGRRHAPRPISYGWCASWRSAPGCRCRACS